MTRLATIIACLFLCACSLQRAETAQTARTQLVGMSKEQILACMGVPLQKGVEGSTEVWSYNSGNGRVTASYNSGVAIATERHCTVNIVLTGGRVSAVNYTGPTGGVLSAGEQCAYAVEGCMR